MNMNEPRPNPDADESAADLRTPEAFVTALRRIEPRSASVPQDRDEQILARCRTELSARLTGGEHHPAQSATTQQTETAPITCEWKTKIIPFPRPWIRWAAAAGIALLGGIILFRGKPAPTSDAIALNQPTILDAFALARKVAAGSASDPKLDLNSDGRVDQADARALAQRAVILPQGGAL